MCKNGRAILIYSTKNEQRLAFKVHQHDWEVVDLDGLKLMRRPREASASNPMKKGWSQASRKRRARRG